MCAYIYAKSRDKGLENEVIKESKIFIDHSRISKDNA